MYRGLLKSIELPWLQCGIEVRGGETKGTNEMESNACPFTPKTYPIELGSTIDISRLLFARNGQVLLRWMSLTTVACCVKRAESIP